MATERLKANIKNFVREHKTVNAVVKRGLPIFIVAGLTASTLAGCSAGEKNNSNSITSPENTNKTEQEKKVDYQITKLTDNEYYISSLRSKDNTAFYVGDELAQGIGKLGETYEILNAIPILGSANPARTSDGNVTITYGFIVKVGSKVTPKP